MASVRWILIFIVAWINILGENVTFGLKCHDCSGKAMCKTLLSNKRTGNCKTGAKCFVRIDSNGLHYRGCADSKNWPGLDYSYNGCRYQDYQSWGGKKTYWCFCDGDYCNGDVPTVQRQYPQNDGHSNSNQGNTGGQNSRHNSDSGGQSSGNQGNSGSQGNRPAAYKSGPGGFKSVPYPSHPAKSVKSGYQQKPSYYDVMKQLHGGAYNKYPYGLMHAPSKIYVMPSPSNSSRPHNWQGGSHGNQRSNIPVTPPPSTTGRWMTQPPSTPPPSTARRHNWSSHRWSSTTTPTTTASSRSASDGDPGKMGPDGAQRERDSNSEYWQTIIKIMRMQQSALLNGGAGAGSLGPTTEFPSPTTTTTTTTTTAAPPATRGSPVTTQNPRANPILDFTDFDSAFVGDRFTTTEDPSKVRNGQNGQNGNNGVGGRGGDGGDGGDGGNGINGLNGRLLGDLEGGNGERLTGTGLGGDINLGIINLLPPGAQAQVRDQIQGQDGTNVDAILARYFNIFGLSGGLGANVNARAEAGAGAGADGRENTRDRAIENTIPDCSTASCDQRCSIQNSKTKCDCDRGYILLSDQKSCGDVNECQTQNGGCNQLCTNTFGSYFCSCATSAYRLDMDGRTCVDVNECLNDNAGCSHGCENTVGSYKCKCPRGFQLSQDRHTCTDVNECRQGQSSLCEQGCTNIRGTFQCLCDAGYKLNSDQRTCDDINECRDRTDNCQQRCVNTPGSYLCECNHGYRVRQDGRSCIDENECLTRSANCSQLCTNIAGGYKCGCSSGYKLNSDEHTCDDIDECTDNNGGCSQLCVNSMGSYFCLCRVGYDLDVDERTCIDINECTDSNQNSCEQECTNVEGSYECSCGERYTLNADKRTCDEQDACNIDNGGCDHSCTATSAGRRCTCRAGFQLDTDGRSCSDINECNLSNGGCMQRCQNTVASYQCSCLPGFTLDVDGRSCDDIDECEMPQACSGTCTNTVGSYICGCGPGYQLARDKNTCEDVDECATDNGGCSQVCSNTEGSFTCSCDQDLFTLSSDGSTCTPTCPSDFLQVGNSSCYRIFSPVLPENARPGDLVSEGLTVSEAEADCQSRHKSAHLVAIETAAEQEEMKNLADGEPKILEGWQGWWTSGKYSEEHNWFEWVLPGEAPVVIMNDNPFWGFKREPFKLSCVWMIQITAFDRKWGNYDCEKTRAGHICEIELDNL